jgi:serine/threonine-protein kinase
VFLLSGKRPFEGGADAVLARRRAGEQPGFRIPEDALRNDPDLCRLLARALGPAAQRPTAAAIAQWLKLS